MKSIPSVKNLFPPAINKESVFGTPLSAAFTGVSLLLLAVIGQLGNMPLLVPPLAATAAYIFGMPGIPGTQPRSVLLGHFIAGVTGFLALGLLGSDMWVAGLAAMLAMFAMNAAKLFHIPAVATAALIVFSNPEYPVGFISMLAAASLFLVLMGFVFSRLTGKLQYPLYW